MVSRRKACESIKATFSKTKENARLMINNSQCETVYKINDSLKQTKQLRKSLSELGIARIKISRNSIREQIIIVCNRSDSPL